VDPFPIAIPFFVLGTYYFTIFFVNVFKCGKCYGQDRGYYEERKMRCCGAFWGFLIIALVTGLVVVGALADNRLINGLEFLTGFNLYYIVAVALGLCTVLLNKQRKSLIVTKSNIEYRHEQTLYDATRLMQTFLVLIYHVSLTTACYLYLKNDQDPSPYTHVKGLIDLIRSILYYKLIPF
jgi:DMSO reductase anchor subunit